MKNVEAIFAYLAAAPAGECDEILGDALAFAEPEYFDRIANILLQRQTEAGWGRLVEYCERLTPEQHLRLLSEPGRLRAGIGRIARSGAPEARLSALSILEQTCDPRMAYVAAGALLDHVARVRDAAARVLRRIAETFAGQVDAADEAVDGARAAEGDRARFAQALREVLLTFDRHHRVELLEVCLWFAIDLGGDLWEALENRRSRAGKVVAAHLPSWNNPRLAGFVLTAMSRSDWRLAAQQMLRSWPRLPLSLLRQSQLLDDPDVRRSLLAIRRPEWFAALDADLGSIPAALRGHVPRWLVHFGLSESEKLTQLQRFAGARDPHVQRAALYALAQVDAAQGVDTFQHAAQGDSPAATFARWYLEGRKLLRPAAAGSAAPGASPHAADERAEPHA